jgi:hypothetical protein
VSVHNGHFTIPPLKLWQAIFNLVALSGFWEAFQPDDLDNNFLKHFSNIQSYLPNN